MTDTCVEPGLAETCKFSSGMEEIMNNCVSHV